MFMQCCIEILVKHFISNIYGTSLEHYISVIKTNIWNISNETLRDVQAIFNL